MYNKGDYNMEQSEPTCQATQSNTIGELAKAVCKMQKTNLFAITDSTNPFFNSKYSDLSSVWSAIREPLTDNGLSIIQTTEPYEDGVIVITTLIHESGEWIRGRLAGTIVPDKKGHRTPQGLLSLITYLRRAGVSAMTGVCPHDDDGNDVSGNEKSTQSSKTKKKSPTLDDEPVLVDYTLPGEDSQAMKDLKEYKPVTTILNKEKTHFKVGKFEVLISEDGNSVWSNIPKFGDNDFDMDACVPCLVSALVRAHGVAFIGGKYGLEFGKEDK